MADQRVERGQSIQVFMKGRSHKLKHSDMTWVLAGLRVLVPSPNTNHCLRWVTVVTSRWPIGHSQPFPLFLGKSIGNIDQQGPLMYRNGISVGVG